MSRRGQWVWAVLAALAACAGPAEADSTLRFAVVAEQGSSGTMARIYAGPQAVMSLGGRGEQSVADAQEVARRLDALAEEGLQPKEIQIRRERREYTILARGERIIQIDRALAAVHKSDPKQLATTWAENIASAFGRPYLSVKPLLVPVGEARAARVRGTVVGAVRVAAESPAVEVSYDQQAKALRVAGRAVGETVVVISDDESTLRLPVRAAKYAGSIAASIAAGVTGNPAPVQTIRRAVQAAAASALRLEPGAWASLSPAIDQTLSLPPGRSAGVPVAVSASGPDYISHKMKPTVTVRNEAVALAPVEVLLVSNSPERLRAHGQWFEGALNGARSARLLYHHVNGTAETSDLVIEAVNLGQTPGRLHVTAGSGGPSFDEAWVGHRASREFLLNREGGTGWMVPVPAGMAVPLLTQRMAAGATASGVLEVRALTQGDLLIRCHLAPTRSVWLPYPVKSYYPSASLGRWQYRETRRQVEAQYGVGGAWAFVSIGDQAAQGDLDGDSLAGSYGVIYDITLTLINPTAESAEVIVYLEPGGGPARATLMVDGRLVEASMLKRDSEATVARYLLAPGQVRRVRIETMPQAGSNYPVRLVARATK